MLQKTKTKIKTPYLFFNGFVSIITSMSSESSSSLTEVENMQRSHTPNSIRQKRSLQYNQTTDRAATCSKKSEEAALAAASDDDETLNEMMGKFDESYIYEKETDILRYIFCFFNVS